MKKYSRARQATDDNTAHALWILDTPSKKINTYIFSTATILTWTRLIVMSCSFHGTPASPPLPSSVSWLPHYRGFTITLRRSTLRHTTLRHTTLRHTTLGRTPLDEWSVRRRDLYLTTHNTYNRKIFRHTAGFKPIIEANERPQTHTLENVATGNGIKQSY